MPSLLVSVLIVRSLFFLLGESDCFVLATAATVMAGSAAAAMMATPLMRILRREICVPSFEFPLLTAITGMESLLFVLASVLVTGTAVLYPSLNHSAACSTNAPIPEMFFASLSGSPCRFFRYTGWLYESQTFP